MWTFIRGVLWGMTGAVYCGIIGFYGAASILDRDRPPDATMAEDSITGLGCLPYAFFGLVVGFAIGATLFCLRKTNSVAPFLDWFLQGNRGAIYGGIVGYIVVGPAWWLYDSLTGFQGIPAEFSIISGVYGALIGFVVALAVYPRNQFRKRTR